MRHRLGGLIGHLVDPLFRHAYTLIVNTGLTSALGLLYWVLAGRLYSAADVGRNAAVISSIVFLAGLAQLNLRPVLSRFLPITGHASARAVLLAYGSASVVAIAVGLVFLLTSGQWAASGPIPAIRDDTAAAVLFIAATVVWTISSLQDGVLVGLRATISLTVENVAFGIGKIAMVIALAALVAPPAYAITASWVVPMLIGVAGVNLLIFRRLIPAHIRASTRADPPVSPSRMVRFAVGDYLGSLFELSYIALLPVIVIGRTGPVAAAQFYIVWVIASSLQFLPFQMVTSLVLDTAGDPDSFRRQGRRMLIGMARLLLPVCIAIVVGAPVILRAFGSLYEGATSLLRLLVLSVIPYSIIVLYLGLARIRVNGPRIITVQAAAASLILGLSLVLIPAIGVDGIGVAFLVGQGVVAAVLLATVLRPLLTDDPNPLSGRSDHTGSADVAGGAP